MNNIEFKSIAETQNNYLLQVLENERLTSPGTYEIAVRVGKKIQKNFKALGQTDDLDPIPTLDHIKEEK